jgi:hypothetical protein
MPSDISALKSVAWSIPGRGMALAQMSRMVHRSRSSKLFRKIGTFPVAVVLLSPAVLGGARVISLAMQARGDGRLAAQVLTPTVTEEAAVSAREGVLDSLPLAQEPVEHEEKSVLRAYKRGRLDRALFLARRDDLTALGDAIEEVQRLYSEGRDARSQHHTDTAIKHLRAALALDHRLAHGESPLGQKIRRELSKLFSARAQASLQARDTQGAVAALYNAAELDPGNAPARRKLSKLSRGGREATRAAFKSRLALAR